MKHSLLRLACFALVAASCSPPVAPCGPEECRDATGACQTSSALACGSNGGACINCGPGGNCVLGLCQAPPTVGGGGGSSTGGGGGSTTGGGGGSTMGGGGGATGGGGGGGATGGGGGGGGGGASTGGGGGSTGPITCAAPLVACNGRCVDTTLDTAACGQCGSACAGGQLCVNGACISFPTCDATHPCPLGAYCLVGGRCVPGCSAADQCPQPGACDGSSQCVCANGRHVCGSACVLDTDVNACGILCQQCVPPANGTALCAAGACDFTCNQGFHRCGSQCLPNASPGSCGSACTPCAPPANATSTCNGTSCDFTCNTGFHRCGASCVSNTAVSSCGASACTPCAPPANATSTCNGTSCDFTCNTGFHRCGASCVSNTAVSSCGSSCSACVPPASGTATCNGTSCDFTCNTGTHRCGTTCASNTSTASCGASCTACAPPANAAATCNGTSCDFTCNAGFHRCGAACVSNTAPSSCGASCTPCAPPANATATCDGTSCDFTCNTGFHRCGSSCVSDTSTTQCGSSCSACLQPTNGVPACVAGSCDYTCNTGFHACSSFSGFERCAGDTDITACGSSCATCPTQPNGSPVCASGSCTSSCSTGYQLCGSDCTPVDSPSLCGATCTTCAAPANLRRPTCGAGTCSSACITNCSGTCVDAQRDEANCGSCGRACTGGQTCSGGQCLTACASGGGFNTTAPTIWDTGSSASGWVVAGDFTGDGRADLATPGALLLAGPNLQFTRQALTTSSDEAKVADLNGDGRADLITVGNAAGLRAYLGTPTGLGTALTVPTAYGIHLELADLNGDSRLDAVLLSTISTRLVRTLLGDGAGNFAAPVDLTVPTNVYSLAVGDVTGDARPDAVVLALDTGTIHRLLVYPGTGTGTFTATPIITALATRGDKIALSDVNRDGRLDVLITSIPASAHGSSDLRWLAGNGAGAFSADTVLYNDVVQNAWAVADLAGDAFQDVAAVRGQTWSVWALPSVAGGPYATGTSAPISATAYALATGDVDADGDRDVVVINALGLVEVTPSQAGVIGGALASDFVNGGGGQVVASDFTGDGNLDFARLSSVGVEVWAGNGAGAFTAGPTWPLASSATLVAVDEDGNAAKDLLVVSGGSVTALRGSGSGAFTQAWVVDVYDTVTQAALHDVDGDGQGDLLVGSARLSISTYYYSLSWYRRTGAATFGNRTALGSGAFFAVGDLDNDGRVDLGVVDIDDQYWTRTARYSSLLNQGSGVYRAQPLLVGPATFASSPRLVDANGDGHLDLMARTNLGIQLVVGDGRGRFTSAAYIGSPGSPQEFEVLDFDGDGFQDVVMSTASSGVTGVFVLKNRGTGVFDRRGVALDYAVVAAGLAVGEFDGTGLTDVLVAGDGQYALLRGRCP